MMEEVLRLGEGKVMERGTGLNGSRKKPGVITDHPVTHLITSKC